MKEYFQNYDTRAVIEDIGNHGIEEALDVLPFMKSYGEFLAIFATVTRRCALGPKEFLNQWVKIGDGLEALQIKPSFELFALAKDLCADFTDGRVNPDQRSDFIEQMTPVTQNIEQASMLITESDISFRRAMIIDLGHLCDFSTKLSNNTNEAGLVHNIAPLNRRLLRAAFDDDCGNAELLSERYRRSKQLDL